MASDDASSAGTAGEDAIDIWPLCPACSKPRVTVCPVCETAGSDFPRADANFIAAALALEAKDIPQESEQTSANGNPITGDAITGNAITESEAIPQSVEKPSTPRLALICSTCDEPWLAEFLRRCEWCGHDFGSGLSFDYVAPIREPVEPLNRRVIVTVGLLIGIFVAVMAWFWWIAPSR